MQRKYTVEELQRMRKALLRMLPPGISPDECEICLLVENRLHTHVLNGTSPEELEEASNNWDALEEARDI